MDQSCIHEVLRGRHRYLHRLSFIVCMSCTRRVMNMWTNRTTFVILKSNESWYTQRPAAKQNYIEFRTELCQPERSLPTRAVRVSLEPSHAAPSCLTPYQISPLPGSETRQHFPRPVSPALGATAEFISTSVSMATNDAETGLVSSRRRSRRYGTTRAQSRRLIN